jgi:hypothetical protein
MWNSITRDVVRWLAYYNLRRADIPLPIIETLFDDTLPITPDAINVGAVRINEVRASLGLPAWSVEDGGENIAKPAAMAPAPLPGMPFEDEPALPVEMPADDTLGGASAASPFPTSAVSAHGMPALSTMRSTWPTSAASPTKPRRRAYAQLSADPTSSPRKPR